MAKKPNRKRNWRSVPARIAGSAAGAVGQAIVARPWSAGGLMAFAVALAFISGNAIWNQTQAHPAPLFATRDAAFQAQRIASAPKASRLSEEERKATTVKIERSDPQLQRIQQRLSAMGFYSGEIDGVAGPRTDQAIDRYAAARGKKGRELSAAQIEAMLAEDGIVTAAVPAAKPQKIARPVSFPVADALTEVEKVQAALRAFGNESVVVDGVAGAKTQAALREFQTLFRLPVTGKPDREVLDKMREIGLLN
ncbi:MAG TPA: peptidoglycan-binding domain-containing protein [Rhizobiaceae bacterium]|nr:peptidoglycan-binding domain-containing protein [Rhizobiaceae bacterium]